MIRLGKTGALALILTGCGSEPAAHSSNPGAAEAAAAGVAAVAKSDALGTAADAIAFHTDSRTLDVTVIEQETGTAAVQMRYTIPGA